MTRKELFIVQLAEFLVGDQALKSIKLEMGDIFAKQWAELRGVSPLSGYPTLEEAIETLTQFFESE